MNTFIRILDVTLKNFKNVLYGNVNMSTINDTLNNRSSIVGLYGQNGSGKTSLIEAVRLVQNIISGFNLPDDVDDYIHCDKDELTIEITYYIRFDDLNYGDYLLRNTVSIKRRKEVFSKSYIKTNQPSIQDKKAYISYEKVDYKQFDVNKNRWNQYKTLLEVDFDKMIISPKYRAEELIKSSEERSLFKINLNYSKKESKSLIFLEDMLSIIYNSKDLPSEYEILFFLQDYMRKNLFVIDNRDLAFSNANLFITMNFRNISFKDSDGSEKDIIGVIPLPLNNTAVIPTDAFKQVKISLKSSNKVLEQLIPGFNIIVEEKESYTDENGISLTKLELFSCRGKNNSKIPLRYESDGIKKIIAFIHILIAMYNSSTVTLLIDELDSGIFEYLLGEIISIVEESGKGQLIFTSHNLRPLEVLDKANLYFTTINPKNRYIQFKNVKSNNNLRNLYYRNIVINEQSEGVYEYTNKASIRRAFRKAVENG